MRLALIVVAGCSTLVGGCVAPLIAGLAAGGGVLGVGEGTDALARRAQSGDDRLKHITAASLQISSADIATVGEKDRRGGILHWVAIRTNGETFRCEEGAGTAICSPLMP